jgi:hypothetical protein
MNVAVYTVKRTKKYLYKVWCRNVSEHKGPCVRFYKTDAVLYGPLLLVKYRKCVLEELDCHKIPLYMINPDAPLFYQPAAIVPCEDPVYEFLEKSNGVFGFVIHSNGTIAKDLMYKCAFCEKCCEGLRCSGCRKVSYCGEECQKKHWKTHKLTCERVKS